MAAERAALQRQILLLQNLIDRHKSLHGDTPVPGSLDQTRPTIQPTTGSSARSAAGPISRSIGRSTAPTAGHSSQTNPVSSTSSSTAREARGGTCFQRPATDNIWRKTYSLKNPSSKTLSTTPSTVITSSLPAAHPLANANQGSTTALSKSVHSTASDKKTALKPAAYMDKASLIQERSAKNSPSHSLSKIKSCSLQTGPKQSVCITQSSQKTVIDSVSAKPAIPLTPTVLISGNSARTLPTVTAAATTNSAVNLDHCCSNPVGKVFSGLMRAVKTESAEKRHGIDKRVPPTVSTLTVKRAKTEIPGSARDQSKFTWVRAGSERPKGSEQLKASVDAEDAMKPTDPVPIKQSRVSMLSKASSRYQWVSKVHKQESRPRSGLRLKPGPRSPKPGLKPGLKVGPMSPKASLSPKDRSRFRWSAPGRSEGGEGSAAVVMETGASAAETSYKLRSRTKIIRRSSTPEVHTASGPKPGPRSRSVPRTGPSRTLVSKHRLRRISSGLTRTSSKDLVSVSRHKLRRVRTESKSCPQSALNRTSPKTLVSVSRHKLRRVRTESKSSLQSAQSRTSPKDLVSVSRHKLRRVRTESKSSLQSAQNRTSPKGLVSVSRHKLRRVRTESKSSLQSAQNRTSPKTLVSVSRHKLRRISPGLSRSRARTGAGSGPTSGAGFSSRFKMDKRNETSRLGTSPTSASWRKLRLQSTRSVLQGRLHSPHMCWIRGALFTVSANRMSIATPPRRSAGSSPFPRSPNPLSRHLARYALQKSLLVARSSLKKKQRQFCIFYNRFGRCNRGKHCSYIHDPDKIAVCTRFLRGRCKDGEKCPFSHKVSKDKMPVCSFFLRGKCLNADCPYSHVYVNKKAQVCDDFLRGYCPQGQKCKKKHTLVCLDKNCLRGDSCKLQHKQPIKRSMTKKSRPQDMRTKPQSPESPDPAAVLHSDPGPSQGSNPSPAAPLKLPSFISLCSSTEEGGAVLSSDSPLSRGGAVLNRGQSLQIKPRLNLNS